MEYPYDIPNIISTPGLPPERLREASLSTEASDTVIVIGSPGEGRHECEYHVRMAEFTPIGFFSAAFANGLFDRDADGNFSLPDEEPAIFEMFLAWLYKGIPRPTELSANPLRWAKFSLMLDKWKYAELSTAATGVFVNILVQYLQRDSSSDHRAAVDCYRLLAADPYRLAGMFSAVHSAEKVNGNVRHAVHAEIGDRFWDDGFARWRQYMWEFAGLKRNRRDFNLHKKEILESGVATYKCNLCRREHGVEREGDEIRWCRGPHEEPEDHEAFRS